MASDWEIGVKASREAEMGLASCRNCGKKGPFEDYITVLYGGGLVYTMCLACADGGHTILIRRGHLGIEVLDRKAEKLAIGKFDLGLLKKTPR